MMWTSHDTVGFVFLAGFCVQFGFSFEGKNRSFSFLTPPLSSIPPHSKHLSVVSSWRVFAALDGGRRKVVPKSAQPPFFHPLRKA